MGTASALNPLASPANENLPKQERFRLILRSILISTIVIFSIETLIMYFLEFYLLLPERVVVVLDGFLLVVFLFPLNHYLIVRPLSRQIEEHHRTNQELLKSYEILERFFSINDVLIAYMDRDFNFIRVNQTYADSDERSPSDYPGKNHFDLFPNEENQRIFEAVVRTGKPYNVIEKPFEYVHNLERGMSYWDWNLLPIKDTEDQVVALLLVLNNVTARKKAQLAQAESERRFRAAFDQTFQHISLLKPAGNVILINQTAQDFTGNPLNELSGMPLWQLPWWGEDSQVREELQMGVRVAAGGEVVRGEYQVRSASGELAIMDITIKPLMDDSGTPVLLIYEARDITERKRDEEALMRSEEEISRLYQAEKRAHYLADILRSAVLALSGSLDSNTVLETLLDHLFKVVPYTSAHVHMLEDEDHMVVRLARGEENWQDMERLLGKRFEISDLPFFEPLLKERLILLIPDSELSALSPFLPKDKFVRSWLAIPLLAGEQVIGVCVLEHHCPNFFTDDLIEWARAITNQAAVAIQNAWLFEQVRDGREYLQALSRRLVEAQESERHHISRELHDEAGQALASLMVGMRLLERDSGDPQAVVARAQELKQIADGVLGNLHRLAIDLRPASLDHLGLVAALRQHTDMIRDQHGLAVQFETVGEIERLPGETETAIYRIVQEALTNVVRHANATRADILIERRKESLIVIVEDNGIGFDPLHTGTNHLGMLGMRERADMLGGSLTIESSLDQGSTVFLEVPCPSES